MNTAEHLSEWGKIIEECVREGELYSDSTDIAAGIYFADLITYLYRHDYMTEVQWLDLTQEYPKLIPFFANAPESLKRICNLVTL